MLTPEVIFSINNTCRASPVTFRSLFAASNIFSAVSAAAKWKESKVTNVEMKRGIRI